MTAPATIRMPGRGRGRLARLTPPPGKSELGDLLKLAGGALRLWPPLFAQSIFGPASCWRPPHRQLSEFRIVDPARARRALRYLAAAGVPSADAPAPEVLRALLPRALNQVVWRPTTLFDEPEGDVVEDDGERWFFINGVATNLDVARMNAALLVRMFGRPMKVIQNATNSFLLDLHECAIGKGFKTEPDLRDSGTFTEPGLKATIAILDALNRSSVDKVVVIAHSQGTIIMANVLRAIAKVLGAAAVKSRRRTLREVSRRVAGELTAQSRAPELERLLSERLAVFVERRNLAVRRLAKLEVYTFANCADRMRWVVRLGDRVYPWLEHFANEHDLVARLGVMSPYRDRHALIDIDGPVYVRSGDGGWGHFLNEHYLFAIEEYLEGRTGKANPYPPARPGTSPVPRLYGYFGGPP